MVKAFNAAIRIAKSMSRRIRRKGSASKSTLGLTVLLYCFAPVQLPAHPSDRWNVPDPPRPEKRPDMVQLRLPADPIPDTEPFGLT
jgi:hypothetical protein